jgi:predicted GH43/DUF377 family glycosyl hydrolase
MFKWKKLGKIFDPREYQTGRLMQVFTQSTTILIFEKFVRVYFSSRPLPSSENSQLSFIFYIDLDRNNMLNILNIVSEPVLNLGALGTFDEFGTNPVSVIREQDEVRMYYSGYTRCESVPFNAVIGVAISQDSGETFSRLGDGPVLSYSPDEPYLLGSPRIRKYDEKWYLFYVAGKEWLQTDKAKPEPVYKIRMASSDDGINWNKLGKDLIESKLGEYECQACPDVIFHNGTYHMFFSYRQSNNYKGKEGGYKIGYASSADMINWNRCDEMAGMSVSESGWDSEMVSYPHVFILDGETYMLYQGNGMGRDGFGLAKLDEAQNWGEK